MLTFEDLDVYKNSRELRKFVAVLSKSFPVEEKYMLKSQIIRSSRSITANIAEGYGRFHYQENIQFLRQSRGSLLETKDHINCALDESYINVNDVKRFEEMYDNCLKLLNGYISYLQNRKISNI